MDRLLVTIPLPPSALSPNFHGSHWGIVRAKAIYRDLATVIARQARTVAGVSSPAFDRARVKATFYCGPTSTKLATGKDDRYRPTDPDNALASLKHAIDGLRIGGLFPDDKAGCVEHLPPVLLRTKKEHLGRAEVVLEIEEWEA